VVTPSASRGLSEQPHDDQNEDDHEQHVNKIAGPGNAWNLRGPEVPQKPKNDENDDEEFEHERLLSDRSCENAPTRVEPGAVRDP
jgi:hypothetical protein